jgi:transcriptional regulator with XRE-family HTH domain
MAGKSSPDRSLARRLGARLRALRRHFGWREETLAVLVQVSAARIRAYENGSKRIPATRLVEFCALFQVPLTYFFSDLEIGAFLGPGQRSRAARAHRMAVELLRSFIKLPSEEQQRELLARAKLPAQPRSPGARRSARIH